MNGQECDQRAARCAANAASATAESISQDFLNLAAQWRAMALSEHFLGQLGDAPLAHPAAGSALCGAEGNG
jgi:hypothetical protein